MSIVALELALKFVRQDLGADDDVAQAVLDGVECETLTILNRKVYEDADSMQADIDAGTCPAGAIVVNAAIKAAILKAFFEAYTTRGDSEIGHVVELPASSIKTLRRYRLGVI
jgi:hypothetical protein